MTTPRLAAIFFCLLCLCCSASSSRPLNLLISNSSSSGGGGVITHLPGFQGPLPFHLQTGYVEVDDSNGVHLFYYFVGSERSPGEDPLILWLTGGPGCSVLTALAYEIGPLSFDLNGYVDGLPKLVYNQDSWTKVSNVIFLDSPVGSGFSYSDTGKGYESTDTKAVSQIVIFLKKWFDKFPQFLSNPLYIGGDSYSGMIVPTVTSEIARGKEDGSQPNLNLKGYLVGNAVTDFNFDGPSKIPFAHGMGLISDEIYEAYKKSCSVGDSRYQSTECINSLGAIDECIKGICPNHVLEPLCAFASPQPHKMPKLKLNSGAQEMLQLPVYTGEAELHLSEISLQCRTAGYIMSYIWANNDSVREALGIHKGTVPAWSRCSYEIPYTNDIPSTVKYHLDVTTKGYRSLVYNGDHDMVIPFVGTQAWIKTLNFSIVDEWRPWFVDGQVAGVVDILLQSTCQGNVMLCLSGGFLVTPFDGVHSSSKFQALHCKINVLLGDNSCGRNSDL
ncbi:serine carboxypeptidase-like 18 isoform X1 [Sorghum bicolor]|uniref:serine carboxypeptidase-like 18 isoform X1 n=1 Tax=Sorghum bicolor TaxID=4558 RepID=UPI000B423745|nr:serine carboxypeptidase-like 18 isoform X1 [Sorghum bicolor]|eukprot:XP_021310918.1 serine carboxypeptidase-like 18 isoform X1 [Sorghum bicolor]